MIGTPAYMEGVATGTAQFRESLRLVAQQTPESVDALRCAFDEARLATPPTNNPYQVSADPGPSRSRIEPFLQWGHGFNESYFRTLAYAMHVNTLLIASGRSGCYDPNYFVQVRAEGVPVEMCANEYANAKLAVLTLDEIGDWEGMEAAGMPGAAIWRELQDEHPRLRNFEGCWNVPQLTARSSAAGRQSAI